MPAGVQGIRELYTTFLRWGSYHYVDLCNDLGRHVEHLGGDPQDAVTGRASRLLRQPPRLRCGSAFTRMIRTGWFARASASCKVPSLTTMSPSTPACRAASDTGRSSMTSSRVL
jgi:hypothetical protein